MRTATQALMILAVAGTAGVMASPARAGTPAEQQQRFEAEARATASGFSGFSVQRGEAFFKAAHGGDWSCATCHTGNPLAAGKHVRTGKVIAPLAPAANAERFTAAGTVEKWFRRNCNDVLGRACTAQEKGDVLQYLLSLR